MLFQDLQRRTQICSNCWRRRYDETEINFLVTQDHGDVYLKPMRKSLKSVVKPHREYPIEFEVEPHPKLTAGMTHVCECGAIHPSVTIRPVTKKQLIEIGQRVVERAREEGYEVDEDVFFSHLKSEKSDPDKQHQDDMILAESLENSLRAVNSDAEQDN